MCGWEQLTREQLLVVVVEQSKVVEQLSVQVSELTLRVAELTRQLGAELGELVVAAVG